MTEETHEHKPEAPRAQPLAASADYSGVGCIAIIIVATGLALLAIWSQRDTLAKRGWTIAFSSAPTASPTPDPIECPVMEPIECPVTPWGPDELQHVAEYKARVRPLALDLVEVIGTVRSLSSAAATMRGVAADRQWVDVGKRASELLHATVDGLQAATPGSIAGTHARLLYAAALLERCDADWSYLRGTEEWGNGYPYMSALACVSQGDVDRAEQEILLALSSLGD